MTGRRSVAADKPISTASSSKRLTILPEGSVGASCVFFPAIEQAAASHRARIHDNGSAVQCGVLHLIEALSVTHSHPDLPFRCVRSNRAVALNRPIHDFVKYLLWRSGSRTLWRGTSSNCQELLTSASCLGHALPNRGHPQPVRS
jgi:hypothetical protein